MKQKVAARLIIEVIGSPQAFVEETLKDVVVKLKEEKGVQLIKTDTYETEQLENKFWSTFAEVELEAEDLRRLMGLCLDYLPSSVEILEPAGMDLDLSEVAHLVNDMLGRLHEYTLRIKNLQAEILYMQQNTPKNSEEKK